MHTGLGNLPTIDWDLSMKLAGNKKDLAIDILSMLINSLPNELKEIQTLFDTKKYTELTRKVHKLHGAICYCGTPRLKITIALLETDLKSNIIDKIPFLLNQLVVESHYLLEHGPSYIRSRSNG